MKLGFPKPNKKPRSNCAHVWFLSKTSVKRGHWFYLYGCSKCTATKGEKGAKA